MTITSDETIERLDFDHTPVCEAVTQFIAASLKMTIGEPIYCDKPAEWRVITVDCCPANMGLVRLYCNRCLQDKLSHFGVSCPHCFSRFSPPSEAYKRIEPLK